MSSRQEEEDLNQQIYYILQKQGFCAHFSGVRATINNKHFFKEI